MKEANENNKTETDMKEIKLSIPDGCTSVTVKVDGENVMTEFELQEGGYKPQDGDIVAYGHDGTQYNIGIYCMDLHGESHSEYVTLHYNGALKCCGSRWTNKNLRPATDEEKQRLFDALAKAGKRWNAEEKRVEDLPRWRAEEKGHYCYLIINSSGIGIVWDVESRSVENKRLYEKNNYFRTREAAERVAAQIREIFKNSKAE